MEDEHEDGDGEVRGGGEGGKRMRRKRMEKRILNTL